MFRLLRQQANLAVILRSIAAMPRPFTSNQLLCYLRNNEPILWAAMSNMYVAHGESRASQQFPRFLLKNQVRLGISKAGKKALGPNIYGEITESEVWN
jgi:hypothetical protein